MLETEIKKLNANIEKLNDLLTEAVKLNALPQGAQDYAKAKGVVSEPDEAPEQAEESPSASNEKAASLSVEDLQSICLKLVRDNRDNKAKIKAVLSERGAKTLKHLDPSVLCEVKAEIEKACA